MDQCLKAQDATRRASVHRGAWHGPSCRARPKFLDKDTIWSGPGVLYDQTFYTTGTKQDVPTGRGKGVQVSAKEAMPQTHGVSAEGFSVIQRTGWCGHDGEV